MIQYTEKIEQYLSGEMSPQDVQSFEQQVKTDSDLAYEVRLQQLAAAGVQQAEEARFQDFKARMKNIESEAKNETPVVTMKPKRTGTLRWVLRIAAVLLLIPALYFLSPMSQSGDPFKATAELIEISNSRGDETVPTAEKNYASAIELFKNKNYEASLALFDQAIYQQDIPSIRPQAMYYKAYALYELDRKAEARKTLEDIMKENDETLKEKARETLEKL